MVIYTIKTRGIAGNLATARKHYFLLTFEICKYQGIKVISTFFSSFPYRHAMNSISEASEVYKRRITFHNSRYRSSNLSYLLGTMCEIKDLTNVSI
jgi:hypothetical protein